MSAVFAKALNSTLGTSKFKGMNKGLEKISETLSRKGAEEGTEIIEITDVTQGIVLKKGKRYYIVDKRSYYEDDSKRREITVTLKGFGEEALG